MMETSVIHGLALEISSDITPYTSILSAIIKRFVWLVGAPAALTAARRIPGLVVDEKGDVLDCDPRDMLGTIMRLLDEYGAVFGEATSALLRTDIRPAPQPSEPDHWLAVAAGPERPATPIRVLVVDDHNIFREGLVNFLDSRADVRVVGQANTVNKAIGLSRAAQPDVVLMDFVLLDGNGVDATRVILAERPSTKVVFLTAFEDDDRLFDAIRAGASGYLSKRVRANELVKALYGVLRGEAGLSRTMARRIMAEFSTLPTPIPDLEAQSAQLTAREIEIVGELAGGATNQEIAQRLFISEHTVKKHIGNVFEKLHLRSRRAVADYAVRHRLVQPAVH